MDHETARLAIADLAAELCDTRTHVERYAAWDRNRNRKIREWRTVQPGLLAQLYACVTPSGGRVESGPRPLPGSRPPLALEALSVYRTITVATIRWCWSLSEDLRDSPEGNIRAMVGATARPAQHDVAVVLLAEMRQWRRWAAVATGWQSPDFTPRAPCPACAMVGQLRINLSAQVAQCRACQATWTGADGDGTIRLLAEHVRCATDRVAA
jgi:hypothetical protein